MTIADASASTDGLAIFGEFDPAGRTAYDNAIGRFRDHNIVLPTFAQLRDPATIPAAIVEQLTEVDKIRAAKQRNFDVYRDALRDVDAISLIEFEPNIEPNYWFNNVLVDNPDALQSWLAAAGIETRRLFYPLHRQPCFADYPQQGRSYRETDRLYDQGLSLPSGATLTDAELDQVVDRLIAYAQR